MVRGLPQINTEDRECESCVLAKQSRLPFPSGESWRARTPLQLVHTDICGPLDPISNGGNKYFITFTDDFSRKTWVYFLKEKAAALMIFKNFKSQVEVESQHNLMMIRSDKGGEYTSKAFQDFRKANGVRHQLTTTYTPQQNGVTERKNRTIMVRKESSSATARNQRRISCTIH